MSYKNAQLPPAFGDSVQPQLGWISQALCLLLVLNGAYGLSPVLRAQVTSGTIF